MFAVDVKVDSRFDRVQKSADDATYENIRHAAFSISKTAKASIVTSDSPSREGSAPHTRAEAGHNMRSAIFVDADADSAVIGPRSTFVGIAGEVHEFGKDREGQSFDERPFMGPALEASVPRFHSDWSGSIGE